MRKEYKGEVFIIDEKDSELFDRAKEQSEDIYFLIENLEFYQVEFVIESDLKEKMQKEKNKVIPTWRNKPLTVSDLLKICKNAVDNGLGDKYVFISQDDEGNGFHALFYSFTTATEDYADLIYQVNDEDLEDIIILG